MPNIIFSVLDLFSQNLRLLLKTRMNLCYCEAIGARHLIMLNVLNWEEKDRIKSVMILINVLQTNFVFEKHRLLETWCQQLLFHPENLVTIHPN